MAEQGTLKGELQRGWQRFWGLSWKVKAPVIAVTALIVIGALGSAGGSDDKPKAASPDATTAPGKPTDTPKPTSEPKATNTPRSEERRVGKECRL